MGLLDFLIGVFTENGYLAVFTILLICGFGVPIPEDISLVAGGVISGLGYANVHVMCAVGITGVLAGDSLMFMVGCSRRVAMPRSRPSSSATAIA